MLITTCDLNTPYQILDVAIVVAQRKQRWTGGVDTDGLMQDVKQLLDEKAHAIGGNAVIGVTFTLHTFGGGISDGLELLAFGTIVKTTE